jgi:hypothetical protein
MRNPSLATTSFRRSDKWLLSTSLRVAASSWVKVICATGDLLFADVDDQGAGAGVLISVCIHDAGGNPALCTTAPDTATSPGIEVVWGGW